MKIIIIFSVLVAYISATAVKQCDPAYISATAVKQCDPEKPIKDLKERIDIAGCSKLPCRLIKNTFLKVSFKFTPEKNIHGLKNHVTADVFGAKLPFVGVDGEDACSFIFKTDGSKVEKCDLKAGEDYFFKNSFEILRVYPSLKSKVHWSLVSPDGKDVLCFEVPIRITN